MENTIPKIGDQIYVPSSYHVYRGEDDFDGGVATINKVVLSDHLLKDHINYTMVGINDREGSLYNYKILIEDQDNLRKRYAGKIAKSNPDLTPEFNQPNSYWH